MKTEIRERLNLDQARSEAAHWRNQFFKAHKKACVSLGKFCEAMQRVQEITSELHQPGLGGQPEHENALRHLLITEPPVRALLSNGYEPWKGWGWNRTADVAPIVRRYAEPA
jgi:hypothetical protein